ncbi:MAG: ABC transporter permease [Cyclobacteriaceae bacterium]
MLKNFLITSIRSLKKQRLFSVVNILGLTIGLTTSILILLWVQDEVSYDNFHSEINQIYRVYEWQTYSGGNSFPTYSTPGILADALGDKYPEIEASAQFSPIYSDLVFTYENNLFYESEGYFTGPEIFEIFSFQFLVGNPENCLTRPRTLVLNRDLAERYFGEDWENKNILGKSILIANQWQYEVSAVVENYPDNSVFKFDFMVPFESVGELWSWDSFMEWGSNYTNTYVRLAKGTDADNLARKIVDLVKQNDEAAVVDLYLFPFAESYLYKLSGGGRIEYVRIFSAIAFFILIIACINFMNLSTAKSGTRSKEVGIRKSIGARKGHLILQFLLESLVIAFSSLLITLVLIHLVLPSFNNLTGKSIAIAYTQWTYFTGIFMITLITGILAGSYPAFYISSFKPTEVLKGIIKLKGTHLRKFLVVLQFALSVLLIVSTIVINKQLDFMKNLEVGFQRENLIYFEVGDSFEKRYRLLQNEFASIPEIENVTATMQLPISVGNSTSNIQWAGQDPNETILINIMRVHYDFFDTFKMQIVEGRDFSEEFSTDSANFVINETFARLMGDENPVGNTIRMWGNDGKIVGVVKDFNFQSFNENIEPMIFRLDVDFTETVVARVHSNHLPTTLSQIEEAWTRSNPDLPFEYRFVDQEFEELYQREAMTSKLFNIFSGLAIFISCLGLFGMAAFTAEQMRKEISIRKVLGATIQGIILLFSKVFTKWVIVANIIALPFAWYIMELWLADYAYRIQIDGWILGLALAVSLSIALFTITYQSVKTAVANPVDSLRRE